MDNATSASTSRRLEQRVLRVRVWTRRQAVLFRVLAREVAILRNSPDAARWKRRVRTFGACGARDRLWVSLAKNPSSHLLCRPLVLVVQTAEPPAGDDSRARFRWRRGMTTAKRLLL